MDPADITPELFQVFIINVSVAILCGGAIGLERQLRQKPAGLRVCILVVMTTAFFITIAQELGSDTSGTLRVLSSIITGVGFLGAGVIFSQGGRVQGITTASLIWALAAVGVTIGLGYPGTALSATFVVMGVLALVDWVEWMFPRLARGGAVELEKQK